MYLIYKYALTLKGSQVISLQLLLNYRNISQESHTADTGMET